MTNRTKPKGGRRRRVLAAGSVMVVLSLGLSLTPIAASADTPATQTSGQASTIEQIIRDATPTGHLRALIVKVTKGDRSGTIANVLKKSPAAGKVHLKTGNRAVGNGAGQGIVLGNSLAGYIDAKSGKKLTFMVAVDNVPISSPLEFFKVVDDQARMVATIYRSL